MFSLSFTHFCIGAFTFSLSLFLGLARSLRKHCHLPSDALWCKVFILVMCIIINRFGLIGLILCPLQESSRGSCSSGPMLGRCCSTLCQVHFTECSKVRLSTVVYDSSLLWDRIRCLLECNHKWLKGAEQQIQRSVINPFAAVLTSYLVMCYLVAVCPSAEYTRHTAHSSNA